MGVFCYPKNIRLIDFRLNIDTMSQRFDLYMSIAEPDTVSSPSFADVLFAGSPPAKPELTVFAWASGDDRNATALAANVAANNRTHKVAKIVVFCTDADEKTIAVFSRNLSGRLKDLGVHATILLDCNSQGVLEALLANHKRRKSRFFSPDSFQPYSELVIYCPRLHKVECNWGCEVAFGDSSCRWEVVPLGEGFANKWQMYYHDISEFVRLRIRRHLRGG